MHMKEMLYLSTRAREITGAMCLTVLVLGISAKANLQDLLVFFSYCGGVDEIQLQRQQDGSQKAYVTFKQPFALQTALLLDGVDLVDQKIRILRLDHTEKMATKSILEDDFKTEAQEQANYTTPTSTDRRGRSITGDSISKVLALLLGLLKIGTTSLTILGILRSKLTTSRKQK